MVKKTIPVYYCPYCGKRYRDRTGRPNLNQHVKKNHKSHWKDYKKIPVKQLYKIEEVGTPMPDIIKHDEENEMVEDKAPKVGLKKVDQTTDAGEPPTTTQPPAGQSQTEKTPTDKQPTEQPQTVTTQPTYRPEGQPHYRQPQKPATSSYSPLPNFVLELPPTQFFEEFLKHYNCSDDFIIMQLDAVNMSGGRLPQPETLANDLKYMKSGHQTAPKQCDFIADIYAKQINEYYKKQEQMKYARRVIPTVSDVQRPHGAYTTQQPQYGGYSDQLNVPMMPRQEQNIYLQKLENLEAEMKRRDEEKYRLQEAKVREQEEKIREFERRLTEQASGVQHPEMQRLTQKLEEGEKERKRLMEEIQMQRDQRYEQRLMNLEAARSSPELVQSIIDKRLAEQKERLDTEKVLREVDSKIQNAVQSAKGPTTSEVEMKKAEFDHDIEMAKIDEEGKKSEMWGDTLKSLVEIGGEAVGRGLAQGGGTPTEQAGYTPQQTPQRIPGHRSIQCPSCDIQLDLPPGITRANCQNCGSEFYIGADGTPRPRAQGPPTQSASFSIEQEIPSGEMPAPEKKPVIIEREFYGSCPKCKNRVTFPAGMNVHACEKCGATLEHDGSTIQVKTEQTPKERPPQVPAEEQIGTCAGCQKPVYNNNIGKTLGGNVYCRDCT